MIFVFILPPVLSWFNNCFLLLTRSCVTRTPLGKQTYLSHVVDEEKAQVAENELLFPRSHLAELLDTFLDQLIGFDIFKLAKLLKQDAFENCRCLFMVAVCAPQRFRNDAIYYPLL